MTDRHQNIDSTIRAEAALRQGDLLAAYDICASGIAAGETSDRIRYLQILALARMGNTRHAADLYERSGLAASGDVDCMALEGRLIKDLALRAAPAERTEMFRRASRIYEEVAGAAGTYFPLINAASLASLAFEDERSVALARRVLATPAVVDRAGYFAAATSAEAHLLLDDLPAAITDISLAASLAIDDDGARSSTLRQLELLCRAFKLSDADREALLSPLRVSPTMMFTGHMFRAGDPAESALSEAIDAQLERRGIRVGYGALACGADILVAEKLLQRGGELNVVLPFAVDDFEKYSVLPGGEAWLPRFRACLRGAHSVEYLSTAGFLGDDRQFSYSSAICMGLACLRARHLGSGALQLAIWDGVQSPHSMAGTAHDIAQWQQREWPTELVSLPSIDRRLVPPTPAAQPAFRRELRAIIFTDFAGFSSVGEGELPVFWTTIMGTLGATLTRHRDHVLIANSWGDALFAVIEDVFMAARIALELQAAIATIDLTSLKIRAGAGMRIGVHYGPVYLADDPITGRPNVFGSDVTLAARIEPITPTGDVYITQSCAAILALDDFGEYETRYVGSIPLAKGYGSVKMFSLARADC